MKRIVFSILAAIFVCLFSGCFEPREIGIVKNGKLEDFEFTVGELVNRNWENPQWRFADGKVWASGKLDMGEGSEPTNFGMSFTVDKNANSFEFEALYMDGEEADEFSTVMILTIMALQASQTGN